MCTSTDRTKDREVPSIQHMVVNGLGNDLYAICGADLVRIAATKFPYATLTATLLRAPAESRALPPRVSRVARLPSSMSRTRRAASGIARPEAARCDDGQCPRAGRGVRRVCCQATAALQGSGAKNSGCAVSYDLLPARGPIGRAQHPIYLRLRKPSLRRWRALRDNMPHIRKNLHLATCAPPPTGPGWAGFASPVVVESPRTLVL